MSRSRANFIDRMSTLQEAFEIDTLNDKAVTHLAHNRIAKLLRSGMAVIMFLNLEDFLKSRTAEVLEEISNSGITFNNLPEKLRFATTSDAISSIIRLSKLKESKSEKIEFIQEQSRILSSSLTLPLSLNKYSLGYKGSNLSHEEISYILGCFNIKKPWEHMSRVSSRIGLTGMPLMNSFVNAANRRHSAAHDMITSVPITDLKQSIKEFYGIAISFDGLLTRAANRIKNHEAAFLNGDIKLDASCIKLSSAKKMSQKWAYQREGRIRSVKIDSVKNSLLSFATMKASNSKELLVIYDENNNIDLWQCY